MTVSSVQKRILSGIVLGPLILICIVASRWTFLAMVLIAFILSVREWSGIAGHDHRRPRRMLAGVLYLILAFFCYAVLRFAFLPGAWLALCAMLSVWASDTGAYFTGKSFKGPKLAPTISPNKTWAGAIGAVVFSGAALAFLFRLGIYVTRWLATDIDVQPAHWWIVFLIGAALGVVGQAGDLLISRCKRKVQLKDTGSIIPGHGGLLDRIDSLLLVAPVFLFITLWWLG